MLRRRLLLPALLLLLILNLASCNETTTAPPPATEKFLVPDTALDLAAQSVSQNEFQDVDLQALWAGSNKAPYETFTQTISPQVAQTITATFPSWGDDYEFEIDFPAGAVPGNRTIDVSISAPVNNGQPYPPVFRLEPDLTFAEPVGVIVHWPPWLATPSTYTSVFCLVEPSPWDNDADAYSLSDLNVFSMEPTMPTKVHFWTSHFSRWGLQNGKMQGH